MPEKSIKKIWKETWKTTYLKQQLIIGTSIMLVVVYILPHFFSHIEKRKGTQLNDFILSWLPAHNVSVIIFACIWGMVIFTLTRALYKPKIYINYCWSLIPLCIARFISISLVALDPPKGLIPLVDPVTGLFYGNALITKDLFFSGHTATMTLLALCLEKKTDKIIGTIAVTIVACLLLVQHIHYTIDIFAAPFITYGCYKLTRYFLEKELVIST